MMVVCKSVLGLRSVQSGVLSLMQLDGESDILLPLPPPLSLRLTVSCLRLVSRFMSRDPAITLYGSCKLFYCVYVCYLYVIPWRD